MPSGDPPLLALPPPLTMTGNLFVVGRRRSRRRRRTMDGREIGWSAN